MKIITAISLSLIAILGGLSVAQAQDQSPVEQLRNSRSCQDCNLSNVNLRGLDLSNTDLRGAILSNADLQEANLRGADLTGANLYLANLKNTNISTAQLNGSNLTGVKAEAADFSNADLSNAVLRYANFTNANFGGANLSNANLSDANFTQANFTQANLTAATLNYADLTKANVEGANFSNAQLSATNLSYAINLETATLTAADLASANLLGTALADSDIPSVSSSESAQRIGDDGQPQGNSPTQLTALDSPLSFSGLLTAETIPAGNVVFDFRQRFFDNTTSTSVRTGSGTPFFAGPSVRVGITNNLEFAAAYQVFDSSFLDIVGGRIDNPNEDRSFQLKYKIWQNEAKTQTLSGIVAVSAAESRGATFRQNRVVVSRVDGDGLVPELQLPFTFLVGDRASFTVAPTLAFFQEDSALLVPRIPANGGSFGTTFGLAGGATYRFSDRFMAWGDVFVPFTGNNSLNFKSGLPAKTVVFNAGLRYFINPRLGLDIFATNALGELGPIALTADRSNVGFGAGITVMPDIFPNNRRYPNNFEGQYNQRDTPLTTDGLGFFDGGTVPAGKVLVQFQGGNSGIMTALRYGVVKDFEFGAYLDYVFGDVDESEQGLSAKVRLLNQSEGAPFTLGVAATLARGNNLLENFRNNDANVFIDSGFDKSFPNVFGRDNTATLLTLWIGTVSVPMQYQFSEGTAVWVTPVAAFVQRGGLSLAGINVGGSYQVFKDVSFLGEVGANFAGDGNAFINGRLADRIAWNLGVRWQPSKLLGFDFSNALARPSFELFVTNRVGASAFQQLRVRENNDPAVGVGVSIPF